jgi:hypothetical protein
VAVSGCGIAGPRRTASGQLASRHLEAAGATRLDVAYGFQVAVRTGQPEAVTLTYDESLADLLDVGVDGPTLRLQLKPHGTVGGRPTLRAEVTMARLEEVRAAGGSTITVAGMLTGPGLRLVLSGASRLTADLALDRAEATVSGSSRLELGGAANALGAQGSGASTLELADLRLHSLDVQLSGASRASVRVDGTIAAQVSGASTLTYAGTPSFSKRETSGASSIRPAG